MQWGESLRFIPPIRPRAAIPCRAIVNCTFDDGSLVASLSRLTPSCGKEFTLLAVARQESNSQDGDRSSATSHPKRRILAKPDFDEPSLRTALAGTGAGAAKGNYLPEKGTTFCRCSPSPLMPRVTTSPGFSHAWVGFMPSATPAGVPVVMMSPGSRVM